MAESDRSVRQKYYPELGAGDTTNGNEFVGFGLPMPGKIIIADSGIRHIQGQKSNELEDVTYMNDQQKSTFEGL